MTDSKPAHPGPAQPEPTQPEPVHAPPGFTFRVREVLGIVILGDVYALIGTSVVLLSAISLLIPRLPIETRDLLVQHLAPITVLLTWWLALYQDRHRPTRGESHFWHDLRLTAALLLSSQLLWSTCQWLGWRDAWPWANAVACAGYAALILAIEGRPQIDNPWQSPALLRRMDILGVLPVVGGVWIYFDLFSWLQGNTSAGSAALQFLAAFMLLRTALFARTVRSLRWRTLFLLLGLGLLTRLSGDAIAAHGPASGLKTLWPMAVLISSFVFLLVARLQFFPFPADWQPTSRRDETAKRTRVNLGARPLFITLTVPCVHFLGYRFGSMDAASREARELWVMLWVVMQGLLALYQYRKLSQELLRVHSERRRMEQMLQRTEQRLRLDDERQRTNDAVDLSRRKFAKAFRHSPYAMGIARLKDGSHLEVNDRYLEILGYRESELLGRTADDIGLWPEPEQAALMLRQLVHDGRLRDFPVQIRRKDGQVRSSIIAAELFDLDGEPCVLSISKEVSYRAIAGNESFPLLDHLQDPAVAFGPTGRISYWNSAAEGLFGWPASEVVGRRGQEVLELPESLVSQRPIGPGGQLKLPHRNGDLIEVETWWFAVPPAEGKKAYELLICNA